MRTFTRSLDSQASAERTLRRITSQLIASDGTLVKLHPFLFRHRTCVRMNLADQIPFYMADGRSLGFRTLDTAERLIAGGFVKPSYGRKKNLRAIWLRQEDGGNPVGTIPASGTRYSFIETLEHARCWTLRRLDRRDDDGVMVSTRDAFFQVLKDCTVHSAAA